MKKILELFKDKVFLSSLLTSIALVLQQYVKPGADIDLKAIGLAVLITCLGIVGSYLKGAGLTILGMIGSALVAFVEVYKTGDFSLETFVVTAALSIIMTLIPKVSPEKKDDGTPQFPYNAGGR